MAVRQYIGARYVPIVIGEWDKTLSYENLNIVTYKGNSFTSKKAVPQGIDISNTEYWVNTGNYNAQINDFKNSVDSYKADVDSYKADVDSYKTDVDSYKNNVDSYKADIDAYKIANNNRLNNMQIFNVKNYGAVGDGITDDSNAFISAISSSNGIIFVPKGNYLITKTLTLYDTYLMGEGKFSNLILNSGNVINVTGSTVIDNVGFIHTAPITNQTEIICKNTSDGCQLKNLFFENCYYCMSFENCSGVQVSNIIAEKTANRVMTLEGCNDIYFNNGIFSNVGNLFSGTAIVVNNYNQAIKFDNINIIGFYTEIAFYHSGADFVNSNSASFFTFSNCYFDNSNNSFNLSNCFSFNFVNCWFSNRGTGLLLDNRTRSCTFTNCMFQNCDNNGVQIENFATIQNNKFINCNFINNRNSGILINGGEYTVLNGCCAKYDSYSATYDFGAQKNGFNIVGGNKIIITNCTASGNANNYLNTSTNGISDNNIVE